MGIIQICIDAKKRTTTIKGYFTVNQEEAIEEYADRLLAGSNLSKAEYKKAFAEKIAETKAKIESGELIMLHNHKNNKNS